MSPSLPACPPAPLPPGRSRRAGGVRTRRRTQDAGLIDSDVSIAGVLVGALHDLGPASESGAASPWAAGTADLVELEPRCACAIAETAEGLSVEPQCSRAVQSRAARCSAARRRCPWPARSPLVACALGDPQIGGREEQPQALGRTLEPWSSEHNGSRFMVHGSWFAVDRSSRGHNCSTPYTVVLAGPKAIPHTCQRGALWPCGRTIKR
ncbi:hypothetical protein N431DRAFT_187150 [Stipitochalara longipes BDJ]|nr:hypothetical protein N431DRAFT_187150 [Stipitochalara longipes BDJ]